MTSPADLSNWRQPGHSQWAFRNVDKIVPTHTIKKGPNTSPLELGSAATLKGFAVRQKDGTTLDWASFLNTTETDGIVILQNGKIVHEQYFRDNTAESRHILMSVSKSMCGLLAGILSAQGKLDVHAPVTKYIPELAGGIFSDATVQACLDMRSNVHYEDDAPEYRSAMGWIPPLGNGSATNLHDFIAKIDASRPPAVAGLEGAPFDYVSVNTDLVGWVLERAAGKPFAELFGELIWSPMGAESDALITVDPEGSARPAGGMVMRLRDLARVGQMVLEGGREIVPRSWLGDLLTGGSTEAFAAGAFYPLVSEILSHPAYRSYWITDREAGVYIGTGIHGQHLHVDTKQGVVIAKFSSQAKAIDWEKQLLTSRAFKEVKRALVSDE